MRESYEGIVEGSFEGCCEVRVSGECCGHSEEVGYFVGVGEEGHFVGVVEEGHFEN